MRKTTALTFAAAATLGFASLAHAQDHEPQRTGQRHGDWQQRGDGQQRHGDWQRRQGQAQAAPQWQGRQQWDGRQDRREEGRRWEGERRDWRAYQQAPHYQARPYVYDAPRQHAYGGQRPYWRGGYLPYEYRSQRYWVNDWRARRLAPPPYGYQWVQTDTGDLLLVALATGLIANLILMQ